MPEPDSNSDPPLIPSPEGCAALIVALIQDPHVRDIVAPLAAQAACEERTLAALLGHKPPTMDPEDTAAAPLTLPGRPSAPPPRWPCRQVQPAASTRTADARGADDLHAASTDTPGDS